MSMTSADLSLDGLHVLYATMSLVFESFFYGIYVVLVPFSTQLLLKRGLGSRSNIFLFTAMFLPFVLSSLYWAVEVAEQAVRIQAFFVHRANRNATNITAYATIFNAVVLFNYIFGDAIVVWRSWVLCRAEYGKLLFIPMVLLVLTTLTVLGTITVKVSTFLVFVNGTPGSVTSVINVLQVSTLAVSFLTNVAATGFISHKAWRHRVFVKEALNKREKTTRVERVFTLLIESGLAYCVSGALVLIFTFVQLPFGTLGDIYAPINAQIAGIYPTIVVVLVGLERTLNDTTFWNVASTQGASIQGNAAVQRGTISFIQFNHDPEIYEAQQGQKSEGDIDV
ncbi:hypothetical protein NM688_g2596 [Phlebia brevispora]|uniref:Uncharacterized protein n=1 Tax=Phlebia brevispora TaxID=194682 RepID=A0ACC1T897_9APHY|nr:hypothetical protein NM688_g2596 [Phlebia brevispora]